MLDSKRMSDVAKLVDGLLLKFPEQRTITYADAVPAIAKYRDACGNKIHDSMLEWLTVVRVVRTKFMERRLQLRSDSGGEAHVPVP